MKRHVKRTDLALYATGDLRLWQRAAVHLHVRSCEQCRAAVEEFRADGRALRDVAEGLPDGVDWARLSAEMAANIRVGLAAGECVREGSPSGPLSWLSNARALTACACGMALLVAGLYLQRPAPPAAPIAANGKTDAIPPGLAKLAERERALDQTAAANESALDKGLSQLADRERTAQALMGESGPLGKSRISGQSLDALGAVVSGVNDPESLALESETAIVPMPTGGPAPAKDLFDTGSAPPVLVADATPHPLPTGAHRVFDASEGTPLDPLLNKTWDLNYAHTVPTASEH